MCRNTYVLETMVNFVGDLIIFMYSKIGFECDNELLIESQYYLVLIVTVSKVAGQMLPGSPPTAHDGKNSTFILLHPQHQIFRNLMFSWLIVMRTSFRSHGWWWLLIYLISLSYIFLKRPFKLEAFNFTLWPQIPQWITWMSKELFLFIYPDPTAGPHH